MSFAATIFWVSLGILIYCYIGYGLLLLFINTLKTPFIKKNKGGDLTLPPVTLLIAAYNEREIIEEKIQNSLAIDYPADL